MDRLGVQHAVLVQLQGQTDNTYQLDCVRRHPDRLVSVVWLDADSPQAPDELERLREQGARGVRLHATTRSPGDDPLAIWRAAARLRLPVSCAGSLAEFGSLGFAALVQEVPQLPIIVEHLGASTTGDLDGTASRPRLEVFALSRFANVYMKIHGLGEFAQRASPAGGPRPSRGDQSLSSAASDLGRGGAKRATPEGVRLATDSGRGGNGAVFPFVQPIPPLLELVYEAFGPRRMLWGSNYPPVSQKEGYANALRLPLERFRDRSESDQAQIFGGTAARLYGI
jgi:L-fuconolactonase